MLTYRKDIDGLRALAVLAVCLFHFDTPHILGGFTGVDVFFVISGYLITAILYRDVQKEDVSTLQYFVRFYDKRIRRILPAFLAMMMACIFFAGTVLLPHHYDAFFKTAPYALIFFSNLQFATQTGYFDVAHEMNLLLHTWSLSVEEQFYLIWPLLLLSAKRVTPKVFKILLATVCGISLIWCIIQSNSDQNTAFFSILTRLWQMGVGGLISIGLFPQLASLNRREILSGLGIIMMIGSFFFINESMVYPGVAALIPTLGTFLLIYANHQQARVTLIGKVLSHPVLRFIGLISFSLYLWHWPILIGYKTLITGANPLTWMDRGLLMTLSLVVSTLSWTFIEQPFRHKPSGKPFTPTLSPRGEEISPRRESC